MNTPPFQLTGSTDRAATATILGEYAETINISPGDLLARAKIDYDEAMAAPDKRVDRSQIHMIIETLDAAKHNRFPGVRIGSQIGAGDLGSL